MKISVVIPSFNDKRIIRTIKSIYNQDFPRGEYEIIVVDGGSYNDDFESCHEFLRNNSDIFISEKDKGIFDGLNKGIDIAKGELIFMIGSDDYLINKNAFDLAYSSFEEGNEITIFELFYVNQANIIERYWNLPKNMKKIPNHFQIPHFSTFVSRKLIGTTKFDLNSHISADFSFFKELLERSISNHIINIPICCMTSGGQSSKNFHNIVKGNIQSLKAFNYNFYQIFRFILHKIQKKVTHLTILLFQKNNRICYQKEIDKVLEDIS